MPTNTPCIMVIFGAAGDLTKRKLIPALYNLKKGDLLSDNFAVIGVARAELNDEEFRRRLRDDMKDFATDKVDEKVWKWLEERLYYFSGNFTDDQTFTRLRELLEKTDQERQAEGNYFFYLATAPEYFAPVVEKLGAVGLTREEDSHWRRVVIEKPFGRNLESAKKLNQEIKQVLNEDQIYRIDHYLGKETVTSWCFALVTASSSRSGIAATSSACKLPPLRKSVSNNAAVTTKARAHCATWCRTICCNWSR